jgi:hypothetical protein
MSNIHVSNTLVLDKKSDSGLLLPSRSQFPETFSLDQSESIDYNQIAHTYLNESERSIIQRWGTAALENLYQLGERIERDPHFARSLNALESRNSPEAIRLLANDLPDLLLSAHVLDTSLGSAVDPIFYRGLPQTGAELAQVAHRLRRFQPSELSYAITSERELLPELNSPALSSLLSASQIQLFGDAQLAAYKLRLKIQPGGKEILEALEKGPINQSYEKLTKIITMQTLERLIALGAPTLKLLRHQTSHLASCTWSEVSADRLTQEVITSLNGTQGKELNLSRSLIAQISSLHHLAWRESQLLLENKNLPSVSVQSVPTKISDRDRKLYTQNLNNIQALTLSTKIGQLPEPFFNRLVEIAATHQSTLPSTSLGSFSNTTSQTDSKPINTSIFARKLEFPEILPRIEHLKSQLSDALLEQDYQIASPVFRHIDTLNESIRGSNYVELLQNLRLIQSNRDRYVEQLKLGMLSIPVETLFEEILKTDVDVVSTSRKIQASCLDYWRNYIEYSWDRYQKSRHWASTFPEPLIPIGFQGTQLLTPQFLTVRYEEIAALIEQNSDSLNSLSGQEILTRLSSKVLSPTENSALDRAKLVPANYSQDYFESLLREGNSVLYRPKSAEVGSGIDGLFVYYRPGNFPDSIKELKSTLSKLDDVAYESLFLTALDRTKGTYMMLLRGMGARQALAGVRFSFGTVNKDNQHHYEILQAVDHFPLHGAPIILESHGKHFVPMLWQIP